MRKALLPMLVSLALCGAATTAIVMSSARAQPAPHKPLMVAASGMQLAANDPPPRSMPETGDRTARLQMMCNDLFARQTAQMAYLETSLQLTAAERPLFQHWKDAKLSIAHRHADACAQHPVSQHQAPGGASADRQQRDAQDRAQPSPADQMAREEDMLKQRLADLQTERPALEAFYKALSPTQKMQLAHAGMQDRMGADMAGMMRRHMFADAMGPRGQRGGGPMGERPMAPPPQDAPPPER